MNITSLLVLAAAVVNLVAAAVVFWCLRRYCTRAEEAGRRSGNALLQILRIKKEIEKKTSLDRLREMSAEDMARWLWSCKCPPGFFCLFDPETERDEDRCRPCWQRWLNKEVEE